jgi:S1-C subfamily serine protease
VVLLFFIASPSNAGMLKDKELLDTWGKALIQIESGSNRSERGFGVVISAEGHVLTAAHVVANAPAGSLFGRLVPPSGQPSQPENSPCPPSALVRQIGWVEEGRISGSS